MRILDTSVLLAAVNPTGAAHGAARAAVESAMNDERGVGLPWAVINGFVRITTRAGLFATPFTPDVAFGHVADWLAVDGTVVPAETPDHLRLWREFVSLAGSGGNLTTDAWIAAIAIGNGASVVSFDSDFARFPNLVWENPVSFG